MARPKSVDPTKTVTVRLPLRLAERIERRARKLRRTRTDQIVYLLEQALEAAKAKDAED
jgi:predicted transcriptional regulator